MEDLEDLIAARATEADERFPHDFVVRLLSGEENPVRVWRDYRGLSQKHLAEMAGMQQGYLSEIRDRLQAWVSWGLPRPGRGARVLG